MIWFSKEKFAYFILGLACLILVGSMGWRWYHERKDFFLSGAPPQEIMESIEPKSVPYDQIKPPAFLATDALVMGSMSSTIGIAFYGDYANPESNSLARQLESWVRTTQNKVRFVYYYLPASTKDDDPSFEAAVFSECSRLLDDAWQGHKIVLTMPKADKQTIELLTDKLETEDGMLYNCRRDKNIRSYIKQKVDIAKGDGIDKAPFVFVGTRVFPAQSASSSSIIRAAQTYLQK